MASSYAKIGKKNKIRYGTDISEFGPTLLANLYSDRTHFLFELLQNAEDAGAKSVGFRLFRDRLEIRHDGREFTEDDVVGISSLTRSTKKDDLTQIGKFGIGFKSVYAFTATPRIYSADEAFEIRDYVRPRVVAKRKLTDHETLIVLPFNHDEVSAEVAFDEIGKSLRNLDSRAILFLRNVGKVTWRIAKQAKGFLQRGVSNETDPTRMVHLVSRTKGSKACQEDWLVFSRCLDGSFLKVEVAFRMNQNQENAALALTPTLNPKLYAFFPTDKDTHLQFLIQGPYRTTPARDNVPEYDEWNKMLVEETGALVADAIGSVRDMGLLTVGFLQMLPIKADAFRESMFSPIYAHVKKALLGRKGLLPTVDGGFVRAGQAVLARARELTDLLNADQLASWLETPGARWLDIGITESRTPELRRYLMNELDVPEVNGERFARGCTDAFVAAQDDSWLTGLYAFLAGREALLRRPECRDAGSFGNKAIIRLADGRHVVPFDDKGKPSAFLPGDFESSFPTVREPLLHDPQAESLFVRLGYARLNVYEKVLDMVLPKYAGENDLSDQEIFADNRMIAQALRDAPKQKRDALIEKVRSLPILLAHRRGGANQRCAPSEEPYVSSNYLGDTSLEDYLGRIGVLKHILFVNADLVKAYGVETLDELGCVVVLCAQRELERHIRPKYSDDTIDVGKQENLRDVKAVADAAVGMRWQARREAFLKQASVWRLLRAKNAQSGEMMWCPPKEVYLGQAYTDDRTLDLYFDQNPDVWFLDDRYRGHIALDQLELLGCITQIRVIHRVLQPNGYIEVKKEYKNNIRGVNGFDPDYAIEGLEFALDRIATTHDEGLSLIVWELAKQHPQSIRGTVETCHLQSFRSEITPEAKLSRCGEMLTQRAWLPTKRGGFCVPADTLLTDLPESFDQESHAAKQLIMALGITSETEYLSQVIDGLLPEERRLVIEFIERSSRKDTIGEDEPQAVAYRDELDRTFDSVFVDSPEEHSYGPNRLPDEKRRRQREEQAIREKRDSEPPSSERTRIVLTSRWDGKNPDTREFLLHEHEGRCQICGYTFTQRNGQPYFEGLHLVSRTKAAWLDEPGNVVCLCANCCAKMLHGTRAVEQRITTQLLSLQVSPDTPEDPFVEFVLCGRAVRLKYTSKHLIAIQEMLKSDAMLRDAAPLTAGASQDDGSVEAEPAQMVSEIASD